MSQLGTYDFDSFPREVQLLELAGLRECAEGSLDRLVEGWLSGILNGGQGARIADYGSGTGERTIEIAREFPQAMVFGLEPSERLLTFSRERFTAQNLTFLQLIPGVIPEQLKLSFSAVLCRLVMQHVSDPLGTLHCIRELLHFGGAVLLSDVDIRDFYLEPLCDAWTRIWKRVTEARRAKGGDPEIGRKLPALLQQAGFRGTKVIRRERVVEPIDSLRQSQLAERWLAILPPAEAAEGLNVLTDHILKHKENGGLVLGPTWYDISALR